MPRALTPFERHLRATPALDIPAREVALQAVDNMMAAATRSGALLEAARVAQADQQRGRPTVAKGRVAVLAQEAYQQRVNAEVAKYRAAFALMAEEHGGHQVVSARRAAAETAQSRQRPVFIQKAQYHANARDSMLRAADAVNGALRTVPPLPDWGAAKVQSVPPGPVETNAFPMLGWRPKKYNDMMFQFFPAEVRAAAGGLSGTPGTGLGVATDAVVGPTEPWYNSLLRSIGFGVQAVGKAAADSGAKESGRNPATGGALTTGGNILQSLSTLLTGAMDQGKTQAPEVAPQTVSTGTMILIGAGAIGVGYIGWKLLKGA